MEQQLNHIIDRLNTDPLFGIRLTNADTLRVICTNHTAAQMTESHGSVEEFLNEIYSSGVKKLSIQPRRRNGNTYKDAGEPITLQLVPAGSQGQQAFAFPGQDATYPTPTQVHTPEIIQTPGLMGGLNAQMIYNYMDYNRVVNHNAELKTENERLKDTVAKLKEEAMQSQYSSDKAAGNKEMLTGILALVPDILTAVGTMKGGGAIPAVASAAAGLGNPANELSPVKQELVSKIEESADAVASYVALVLNSLTQVPGFGEELDQLLIKFNLLSNNG